MRHNKYSDGFLRDENISHDSEPFKYIRDLHEYLWRFIHTQIPSASGKLSWYLDTALEMAEHNAQDNQEGGDVGG